MSEGVKRVGKWQWSEERRLQALDLRRQGLTQQKIAEQLGVTQGAVSHWLSRAASDGVGALQNHKPAGSKPRLSPLQRGMLLEILRRGAEGSGFLGNEWTLHRIAEVIQREFGVSYHRSQVSRILKSSGWSIKQRVELAAPPEPAQI
jgi:transposase